MNRRLPIPPAPRRWPAALLLLIGFTLPIGCTGGPGGSTPTEAFAAFKAAAQAEDWLLVFDNVSPDTQIAMLVQAIRYRLDSRWFLAIDGEGTPQDDEWFAEFDRTLRDNGLDPARYRPGDDPDNLARLLEQQDERVAIYEDANDPRAFLSALIALNKTVPGRFPEDKAVRFSFPTAGEISDIRIAGAEATGRLIEGEAAIGEVEFRQVEGRWYVHVPDVAPRPVRPTPPPSATPAAGGAAGAQPASAGSTPAAGSGS